MPNINWLSFALGAVFASFILPMILGFLRGNRSAARAA